MTVTRRGFFSSLGAMVGAATVGAAVGTVAANVPSAEPQRIVLELDSRKLLDIIKHQAKLQVVGR